jgi:SNF2 family DNA or RNA helicase
VDAVGKLRRGEEKGKGKRLCVENFYWKRIVFDEFHELLSNDETNCWTLPMRTIYAKHRWGLTGTPPTTSLADLSQAAVLLHLELGSAPEACKDFCQKCVRTNGLEEAQAVLPPLEHVVDVELSDPERALYEHRKAEVQRRTTDNHAILEECILACNTWEGDTPGNALDKLKTQLADQVRQQEEKQKMWQSLLKSHLLKLHQPGLSVAQREKLRGEKDEIEDNVRIIERDYDAACDAQQRLATILNGPAGGEATADYLALRYGAKVAAVLGKIRQLLGSGEKKICVYVQFNALQQKFCTALMEAKISFLVLKGGPAEITGALKKFTEEDTHNVLVLSLAKKAAGINLTCSSQVLFLHPFLNPDHNRAKAWEAQAIGRVARAGQKKQVHVWRFLTRATVEDELRAHFCASSWETYFSKFSERKDEVVPMKEEPNQEADDKPMKVICTQLCG